MSFGGGDVKCPLEEERERKKQEKEEEGKKVLVLRTIPAFLSFQFRSIFLTFPSDTAHPFVSITMNIIIKVSPAR